MEFCPPLPEFKEEALGGLAMGTENRVAMLFDQVGQRCTRLSLLPDAPTNNTKGTLSQPGHLRFFFEV